MKMSWRVGACVVVASVVLGGVVAQAQESKPSAEPTLRFSKEVLVQLAVSDLERSMKFYGETLGLELVWSSDELKWAEYKTNVPGAFIGIGVQEKVEGSGTISINLGVADLDAARTLLESRGVTFPNPSVDIPGVVKLADFADPDGNRLRLAGPSDEAAAGSTE